MVYECLAWVRPRYPILVPEAWIDASATKIGYEILFTRHFYKPTKMRPLEEIKADLLALQQEGESLLEEIVGGGKDGE